MSNNRVYLLMVLTCIFWAGAFVAGKLSAQEFPAVSLTFFRFLIALPFIFLILIRLQPSAWKPTRKQWPPLILLGIAGTFFYHILFFSSLKYTSAINSSLIGSSLPMVTTFISVLFFQEKMSLVRLAGVLLAFSGVILTITNGDRQVLANLSFNTGDLIMFLAICCWALYMALSRKFMQDYRLSPIMLTAYTFLVCTLASAVFVPWEGPAAYLPGTTLKGWLAVIYMAIFPSVLGYLIQSMAVEKIGAARTSIFVNLVPVFTIILAMVILGEEPGLFKLFSTLIIISGVYITSQRGTPGKRMFKKAVYRAGS